MPKKVITEQDITTRFEANRTLWMGYIFYGICRNIQAKTTMEIGVRDGYVSAWLVKSVAETGGMHFCIDINLEYLEKLTQRFNFFGLSNHVRYMHSDSLKVKWNKKLDFLFIDSSHIFKNTWQELEKYSPWICKGGYMALHDYRCNSAVTKACKQFFKDKRDIWDIIELCKDDNHNTLLCLKKDI